MLLILSCPAAAQGQEELRRAIRDAAAASKLSEFYQALTVFGATPGVSAANYYGHDQEGERFTISNYKVSPSHTFDPVHGISPYVEGSLGYLSSDQTFVIDLGAKDPTLGNVDIRTFGILGGVGADIELFEGTHLRPILLGGYTHIWDNDNVSGPFADEVREAGKGILFDVRIDSYLLGGALELVHSRVVGDDIRFDGSVRYNQLYVNSFDASDSVLEKDGTFGVFTAGGEFNGPTGWTLLGRELRWIGYATNTYLPGTQTDSLGFSYFFELGGGMEIVDRNIVSGIEGVSLRTSAIVGDNVVGWTAGLSLEF